jgi:hypothetical protein
MALTDDNHRRRREAAHGRRFAEQPCAHHSAGWLAAEQRRQELQLVGLSGAVVSEEVEKSIDELDLPRDEL